MDHGYPRRIMAHSEIAGELAVCKNYGLFLVSGQREGWDGDSGDLI